MPTKYGRKVNIMLFRKTQKVAENNQIANIRDIMINSPNLTLEQRAVLFNVLKCMETHDHKLVRRTGLGQKAYMADMARYCNFLIFEHFGFDRVFYCNKKYVAESGCVPLDLISDEIAISHGKFGATNRTFEKDTVSMRFDFEERSYDSYAYMGRENVLEKYGENFFIGLEVLLIVNKHFLCLI